MATLVGGRDVDRLVEVGRAKQPAPTVAGNVLIERAKRGDRSAQAALFAELQDVWFRFCVSILGDADAAGEAVQETALRFLQRLSSFRGDSRLRTWALGIALNVCRELSRKARRPVDANELGARRRTGESRPDAIAAAAEQHMRVRDMVDQLPPRQREAVVLRYFEQLDIDQTAQVMGCAAGTVKATVAQALGRLRRKYEDKQ